MKAKILVVSLLLLVTVVLALGYVLEGEAWPQNSSVAIQLSLGDNSGTLIDGSTSFNASAEDALAIWNRNLTHFSFGVVRSSTIPPASGDRYNSVFFSQDVFGQAFGADTLAVTVRLVQGSTTVESDTVFNSAMPFNSYRGALRQAAGGGTLHDLHRVALHEFGHALGLGHPDDGNQTVTAIMNSRESDVDTLQRDDIAGAQFLYGGTAPAVTPTPAPAAADKLYNLSTRAFVGSGDNVLIGGFVIQGVQSATVALRAIGPSLTGYGVPGALDDPKLELRNSSGTLLQANDDWQNDPNADTIRAKNLAPSDRRESALVATLPAGSYTALVRGFQNGTGIALVELYDLQASGGRAQNISTRALVQTGARVMIGGFAVGGDTTKQVIIRAIGPSLSKAGITNPLPDPLVELRDSNGNSVASNDDWRNGPDASAIQARSLAPTDDKEAALLATLRPGSYTALVRDYNGSSGVALVEVYDQSAAPNQ